MSQDKSRVSLWLKLTQFGEPAPKHDKEKRAAELVSAGNAAGGQGNFHDALDCFELAIRIHPECQDAWSGKATALDNLQQWRQALAALDRLLEINPRHADAWTHKGTIIEISSGDSERAIACHACALQIDPERADAWLEKGVSLNCLQRFAEGLACLDRAVALRPRQKVAWNNRGNALDHLGRPEEAIESYSRAIDIDPEYTSAWYNKGVTLLNSLRDRTSALDCFKHASALGHPKAAHAMQLCAAGNAGPMPGHSREFEAILATVREEAALDFSVESSLADDLTAETIDVHKPLASYAIDPQRFQVALISLLDELEVRFAVNLLDDDEIWSTCSTPDWRQCTVYSIAEIVGNKKDIRY